jgi:hypothetical protein
MTEETIYTNLTISLKASVLRKINFINTLNDLMKKKFENTSLNNEGFITSINSVKVNVAKIDHVSAELNVSCKCNISILRITTDSVISIKLSTVKPEAMRGEMINCKNIQILIPRKGMKEEFLEGDIINVRPVCVRYEPLKVSAQGSFVDFQKKNPMHQTMSVQTMISNPERL